MFFKKASCFTLLIKTSKKQATLVVYILTYEYKNQTHTEVQRLRWGWHGWLVMWSQRPKNTDFRQLLLRCCLLEMDFGHLEIGIVAQILPKKARRGLKKYWVLLPTSKNKGSLPLPKKGMDGFAAGCLKSEVIQQAENLLNRSLEGWGCLPRALTKQGLEVLGLNLWFLLANLTSKSNTCEKASF